jgi:predicted CXXCH cytochrome family protein
MRMAGAQPPQWRRKLSRIYTLRLLFMIVMAAGAATAKIHPVPLEKNTDPSKCIECHEDKSKGKVVHSAIAMGCTTCHEIRVNRDITRVKLTTATPLKLCLQCHADKNAKTIKGLVHNPAIKDCLDCHNPHTSDNKFQLVKASAGAKGENLCLNCHKQGMDTPKGGSHHAALDMGCNTCHTTHKAGDAGKREFRSHLTKDAPALCLDCHNATDDGLTKAHKGQPFQGADCLACHDPHQSKSPKLMQAFTHSPFESGACDTCHQPAKDGKVVLTTKSSKELCLQCHADKDEEIQKAKVPHPGAMGDCTDCHSPHAGKAPGHLKPDPVNACLNCHASQAEQHNKKHLHQPVFVQGCAICHAPHGGDNPKLLRAVGSDLCLECHNSEKKPGELKADHLITIFGGKVKLPEDYFDRTRRFPVKFGLGHPTAQHPVQNLADPLDPTKNRVTISCMNCHQPHAGDARAMLVGDVKPGMQFCRKCHTGMIGAQ